MKRIKKRRLIIFLFLLAIITCTLITVYFLFFAPMRIYGYNKTLDVGQYDNEPKIYEDENGKVIGIFPEILEYIAEKESWKINYVKGSWSKCLDRLEEGENDIMVDVAFSEERAEKYDFNNVEVFTNWGIIYVEVDSDIDGINDLDGKKIATMTGSIHTEGSGGIKNMSKNWGISPTFIEVEDYKDVFELIEDGEVDAGVVNRLFGLTHEDDYDVEKTTIIFNPMRLMFAFPKNQKLSKEIIPIIDDYLLELKEDRNSVYYQIIDKYVYKREFVLPTWIIPVIISTVALIIILTAMSYVLKRKVNKKTAELQKAHDNLEKKVEERSKELIIANIRLKELDRLKSMFLANMSHELRTPLTSIMGFTSWLLQGKEGDLNEEQHYQLDIVKKNAENLLELINNLLDISQIEAGKITLNIEEFNIVDVVNEVGLSLLPLAQEKDLELIYNTPKDIIMNSDRHRIRRILINLIGNAIKFTNSGKIRLDVKVLDEEKIKFIISDTGIGIKDEDINKLFKSFQQLESKSIKDHEGSGLGLYLCKQLVDLMNGTIAVKSKLGEGSEFSFIVPINLNEV
ncbi:MAG: transporter substrate-binding domain-containing protein [Promethearchaeota archaeon]|nr:MAG: transporter substrate-binding domain-containing protein [Candidatus Lokiarchaeota archaeon]